VADSAARIDVSRSPPARPPPRSDRAPVAARRAGHGPPGNLAAWADDPRWDGYEYVGTNRTSPGGYDLHWLLRRDSPHRERLGAFLRARVVDGWYEALPLPLGPRDPPDSRAGDWIAAEPDRGRGGFQ
jgi:hypothetical protein